MAIQPLPSVEKALLALLDRDYPPVVGHPDRAGGNQPDTVDEVYVEISRVPGGNSTRTGGVAVIDVDCYAPSYDGADSAASDVEALLFGYPHVVEVGDQTVVLDHVEQNIGPAERPWQDDSVTRIGATYVISLRRR